MTKYEKISENCKIKWLENLDIKTLKYTQVSGYILDKEKKLLIVKKGEKWSIPSGNFELGETKEEILERAVMDETCYTIDRINYLGAVEVVEDMDIYYQLRYLAFLNKEYPIIKGLETLEIKFVTLEELPKYISYANGICFTAQIESLKKILSKIR